MEGKWLIVTRAGQTMESFALPSGVLPVPSKSSMFLGIDSLFELTLPFMSLGTHETHLFKAKSTHKSTLTPDR
jgi:hypothetical protein